jgi:DNA-binding transcriptional ArsR family regulator
MRPRRPRDCAAFDALGNPTRREIIGLLYERQRSVGELAEELPVSRPAVSKHLRLLEDAGLVACEARGNRNVYWLEARGFEGARSWLDRFWDEALARIKLMAENTRPRRKRG